MSEAPFRFRCVRDGKPVYPDEVPKLPLRAVLAVMDAASRGDLDASNPRFVLNSTKLATQVVADVFRVFQPNLSAAAIEDEDYAEVKRAYSFIQDRNPDFFAADAKPGATESPKGVPPA